MKSISHSVTQFTCLLGALVAGLCLGLGLGLVTTQAADGSSPDGLRDQAQQWRAKAKDLNAQGAKEDARDLLERAEQLDLKAKLLGKALKAQPNPEPREVAELRVKAGELRARMNELAAAGNQEGAAELERKLVEIKERLAQRAQRPEQAAWREQLSNLKTKILALREAGRLEEAERLTQKARSLAQEIERLEPGPRREGPLPPPSIEEAQRRIHHLLAAAENLRALGRNEPAEDLGREAAEIKRSLLRDGQPRVPEGLEPKLRQLQAQVDELRQGLKNLNQRIEELARDRR